MAKYGTFLYGSGTLYGGLLPGSVSYRIQANDPSLGVVARYIRLALKYTGSESWSVDNVRLTFSRKMHVLPMWVLPVHQRIKRTRVTFKYTGTDEVAIDSIRLKQRITHQGPTT